MNTATRTRTPTNVGHALRLLVIIAAGGLASAACSSGGSTPMGTGGSGGSGGAGGTAAGGTTGTGGSSGTGGSGGYLNPATCGERGTATATAANYTGTTDFFIIGEAGLGTDVCVVRYEAVRVGAPQAGCPDCNWAHLVELRNPTVMVNEGGACDASDSVPALDATGRAALMGNRSSRGFSLTSGHGDALLKYSDTMKEWIGVGRANWSENDGSFAYNISNGNCNYGR